MLVLLLTISDIGTLLIDLTTVSKEFPMRHAHMIPLHIIFDILRLGAAAARPESADSPSLFGRGLEWHLDRCHLHPDTGLVLFSFTTESPSRVFLPASLVDYTLRQYHDICGHLGLKATLYQTILLPRFT